MRISTFQCAVVHFVNAIILINLLGAAFLPTYTMAQSTTEEDEERIEKISKGQWDGALGVKSFTLPGIDTSAIDSDHTYKQEDGTYDFSTIKMNDLFQGFNEAQHEAYAADLLDIQENPHEVQDAVYQMELDKATYADVECPTLATVEEQQRCELTKQASLLEEMRENGGGAEFFGKTDSLLTGFSAIADGTHPYYAELQNEECVETVIAGEDGEEVGITTRNVCVVTSEVPEQVCHAERYQQSTKVGEKVVVKYPIIEDPGIQVLADGFDAIDIRDCPNFDSTLRTCLEIDILTSTDINRVGATTDSIDYIRTEARFQPYSNILLEDIKRIKHYTVRSDFLAPNMTLPSNLGQFIDDPSDHVTDPANNLVALESGFFYEIKQQEDCHPLTLEEGPCPNYEDFVEDIDNGEYGTAFDNADMFRYNLSDSQLELTHPPHTISGLNETYQISPFEPYLLDQGFDNDQAPFEVAGETGTYYPPGGDYWYHIDILSLHGYYPESVNVTDMVEFPEDGLQYYSFNRIQLVFTGKFTSETPLPPDPVDDSTTTITKFLIDDIDTYPRVDSISVLGASVDAEINVFDQGTYGLSDYFPTNLRVVGDSVVNYTIKTIGRPTDRYEYEIEIEFDAIEPFEVIADIHRIDEQGFRPTADEDPNCQSIIDLYTTGAVNGTAVCDYEIAEDDGSSRVSDDGVLIDWPHRGYFGYMPDWTPDGAHGLPNYCYDATINVDPSEFGGFGSLDLEIACSGLEPDAYDACLRGEYCAEDVVNGGISCFEIGEELRSNFADACGAYIADENCEHKPNETRCESSIERDGETVCLYESHVFECGTETEYDTIGTRDSSEVACGTPRDCLYGECNNLVEESNEAFLRATALAQLIKEAKNNGCRLDAPEENVDEESCTLFRGTASYCKQPQVWGTSDCCNPNEMGMASMDVVAYWKMYEIMDDIAERVDVAGYMSQAWDVFQTTDTGAAIGEGLGSMSRYITQIGADAYSYMTQPIIAGWEATFQSFGFSPESEIVKAASDFFDMGTAITNGQGAATGATQLGVETASQTATSGGTATAVGTEGAFTGIYAYIAHGINNLLISMGYTDLAASIFAVSADGSSIAFNTQEGTWGSYLNTMSSIIGYIMLAYMIYQLYMLVVGVLYACNSTDFEVAQKIKLLSSHYVGSWCSQEFFIGGCAEYSQAHCIYPSVFTRILAEEFRRIMAEDQGVDELELWIGNPDLAIDWTNLNCHGFTLDEVTNMDWDRVDLSEYEEVVLAKLRYDPNNMPEDFVKSDYMVEATGPQAGKTLKELGAAQAGIVGYGAEQNLENFNPDDRVLDDPDYMPWFDHGSSIDPEENCIVSCDTASGFYYSSDLGLCLHSENVPYPATFTCDTANGYVLVEETANEWVCRKAETIPVTLGCRTGFVLDEDTGQCTKDTVWYEPKIASCPVGYRLSALQDACELVVTAAKERTCAPYGPGFSLVDGICQQVDTETASPFLSCASSDYIVEDGECVLRTEVPPALGCTAPLEYNEVSGECVEVSYDSMPATFSCDAYGTDFILSYGQCVKKTVTTGTLTCDTAAGFALVDGQCQRSTTGTFDATTTCPDGYIADANDTSKCFQRIEAELRPDPYCEDTTYTLIDDTYCQKILSETLPAEPVCLSGYEYDEDSSLCVRVTRYPPTIDCPSAEMLYDANTGLCRSVTHETTPPTLTCHDGDVLDGTNCIATESEGFSISCPDDYYYNIDTDSCILQELDRKSPSYWCPIGTSREGDRCFEYDYTEPTRTCASPKVLNTDTNMCEEVIIISEPPLSLCPAPSYRDYTTGLCMVDEIIPADIDCPVTADVPYTYNPDTEMCERDLVDEQLSVFICPPDETECNTADERDPVPTCADGSINLETGRCDDYAFTYPDAIAFCEDGSHFYNASTNRCEYMETLSAVKCGPPLSPYFYYDGATETCKHQNTVSEIADCVPGYTFDGTNCVNLMHTPMTCSDPSMVFDDTLDRCVKTTLEPAVVDCQPPYVVDPDNSSQCRLPPTHEPICENEYVPVGYDTTSDRCRHLGADAQHPGYVICPPGSINQDNAHCYSGNTSSITCPTDFSYNAATDRCEFTPTQTWYCTGETVLETDPDSGELKCMYEEERRPVCPSSDQYYDIDLNKCVIEEIVDGTMVCNDDPPFYRHLDGKQCMTVARVPYEEPDVCPDGYYPADPSYCEAQVTAQPPEFNCPAGYERNMDDPVDTESPRCVRYVESTPECDIGFTLVGNFCVQKHYDYDPIESCLYQGQTLFGDACTSGQQDVAPICADGSFYSSDYNVCIELTEVAYTQSCLSSNFVLDADTGICNSIYDEAPTCMDGYSLNTVTNLCEQIYMDPVCDEANGFFYDTDLDVCRKYETEPADFFCDAGERDDGDGCTPIQTPTCNAGWVFEPANDRCYRMESQPYEPNCTSPYVDYGGECVLQEAVDCSIYSGGYWDAATETCKDPQSIPAIAEPCAGPNEVLIGDICYDTMAPECPPEAPTYNSDTNQCEGTDVYPGIPYCDGGDYDTGSGCTPQVTPTCIAGYTFDAPSDTCVKTESFTKNYECDAGTLDGDECVEIQAKLCPAGYSDPDMDGVCTKRTAVPADHLCDNGETPPACEDVDEYPATCPAGYTSYDSTTCSKSTDSVQQPSCSSGLTYNHSNNTCEDVTGTAPTESCPGGDTDGDPSNGCTSTDTDAGRITCSAGYTYNSTSKQCEKDEYVSKTCASGTLQADGSCIENHGYAEICDADKYAPANGYDSSGNCFFFWTGFNADTAANLAADGFNCFEEDELDPPQWICDKVESKEFVCYYDEVDGQCIEDHGSATCPGGYTSYSATQCTRTVTQTPTCSGGYTWTGSTCTNTYDNGSYTETCPAGESISGGMCYLPDQSYSCASGHSFINNYAGATNGDRCVETTVDYQSKQCLSGGTLQASGQCQTITYGDDYYQCDSGILEGSECATYDDQDGCDTVNGYVYYAGSNDCRRVSSADLETCPGGWTDTGPACTRTLTDPPVCAGGYYYEAATNYCQLVTDDAYSYDCGTGSYAGSGMCNGDVSATPGCSGGYTFIVADDYCREDSGSTRPYSCPDGTYTFNAGDLTCNRIVDYPPNCVNGSYDSLLGTCVYGNKPHTPNCYDPYVDNAGQCELYLPEPPICPGTHPTFNPTHDTCDGPKEGYNYDCDTANGFTPIDGDITMCEKTTYESSTCPIAGQVLDTTDDQCKTYSYTGKTDQCDSLGYGTITTGGNCETYYGQGYVTCNPGYRVDYDITRDNLVCHSPQTQTTTAFCPFGYVADSGSCVEVVTNDVDYSCAQGWALVWTGSEFQCQQFTDDVYPSYECLDPSSPLYDAEACRAEAITDVGEVEYTCQGSGYEYDEEDHICRLPAEGYPVNEYCENPFYVLTPLTPDEMTGDGREYKCVYEYVDSVLPDLSCPDADPPYELRATGNCVRSEPIDGVVACMPGYELSDDGTECTREEIQESMPDITCPSPYEETHTGECLVTTITDATTTCDPAESTTNNCSMQIDSSTGTDQYGEFATPIAISASTPFEVSMTIACSEPGEACVLLGSTSASGDGIYINASGTSFIVDDNGTVTIYAIPVAVDISILNRYHVARDYDNEMTVSINDLNLGTQTFAGALQFERSFRHAGLGEHSMVDFSSAAIANYSSLPQLGHVYKPSCDAPSNILPDLNMDNDLTLFNTGAGGGPVSAYDGTDYQDNIPPITLSESEWDLVDGVCEKLEILDEIPPTLTCNGEIDTDGECVAEVVYPATPTCDADEGWAYNSLTFVCERTVIDEQPPSSYSCADTTHVLVDGMCQYSEGILPEGEGCAEGYEYDSSTSSCGIYLVLIDEAVLCEDGHEQKQNVCFERVYTTPDAACPTNTVDIGGGLCQGTVIEVVDPDVSCSAGDVVGVTCVEQEIYPADISCSDPSYEVLNNICYKDIIASTEEPTETCIPGYTLEADGLCHFESTVPALVECPDIEYSYNAATELCERTNVQNYRPEMGCPEDGEAWESISSTTCELVTESLIVTRTCEDAAADDSGEQCRLEGVETHTPDFCEAPYQFVDDQCVFYEYERPVISCPDIPNVHEVANGCMEVIETTQAPVTSC